MSDNQFWISHHFQHGKLNKKSLIEILESPIKNGKTLYDSKFRIIENTSDHLEKYIEQVVFSGKSRPLELDWWLNYDGFQLSIDLDDKEDRIEIDFHQSSLNPTSKSGNKDEYKSNLEWNGLDHIYKYANSFIDYSKFMWELAGGGFYVAGDTQIHFHSLYDLKIPIANALTSFWFSIVPDNTRIPEMYSYSLRFDGTFSNEIPWYRKEKIKGGTILVSSPLPYWSINEVPKQTEEEKLRGKWAKTQWDEFESHWKKLEIKK